MSYKGKIKKGEIYSKVYKSAQGYDLYADSYEKDYEYLNSFENDVLYKFLGNLKDKEVLDVGCGTGRLIKFMSERGAQVSGTDVSEGMLEIARKNFPDLSFVKAEAENLPYEDNSFDLVVAAFVIVHLKNLDKFFEEVYRVLKDGGVFILSNINQRKAPKLELKDGEEIVIESHYHRPEDVLKELGRNLFNLEKEEFVFGRGVWINQVIKAKK